MYNLETTETPQKFKKWLVLEVTFLLMQEC